MKKLLAFILIMAGIYSATAQKVATYVPLAAGDTITNSGTTAKKFQFLGGYQGVAMQVYYKKISGTNAGTVVLYKSLYDGDYRSTGDTLKISTDTVLNVSIPNPVFTHYKWVGTGSGTMSGTVRFRFVGRLYKQE